MPKGQIKWRKWNASNCCAISLRPDRCHRPSWSTCPSADLVEDRPSPLCLFSRPSTYGDKRCWDFCALCGLLSPRKGDRITGSYKLGITSVPQRVTPRGQSGRAEMTCLPFGSTLLSVRETLDSANTKAWDPMGDSVLRALGQGMLADLGGSHQKSFPHVVPRWFSYTTQHRPSYLPLSILGPCAT